MTIWPSPYQGCALPLSYRGDRRDCLVFSGAFRKRVNPQPCRTAQNDSQTCSAAWEIAGRCVPESSRERRITFGCGDMYAIGPWKHALHRQMQLAPPDPAPVILSSGQSGNGGPRASIATMARSQGLDPSRFDNSPFSVTELRRAIANGVPLPMGRAIARAVKAALSAALGDPREAREIERHEREADA